MYYILFIFTLLLCVRYLLYKEEVSLKKVNEVKFDDISFEGMMKTLKTLIKQEIDIMLQDEVMNGNPSESGDKRIKIPNQQELAVLIIQMHVNIMRGIGDDMYSYFDVFYKRNRLSSIVMNILKYSFTTVINEIKAQREENNKMPYDKIASENYIKNEAPIIRKYGAKIAEIMKRNSLKNEKQLIDIHDTYRDNKELYKEKTKFNNDVLEIYNYIETKKGTIDISKGAVSSKEMIIE